MSRLVSRKNVNLISVSITNGKVIIFCKRAKYLTTNNEHDALHVMEYAEDTSYIYVDNNKIHSNPM